MRTLLIVIPLLLPALVFAQIPNFPMAFWGTATINGNLAPSGTIIRAYYGSTLAGTVIVEENGTYGYTEPTKQKLVIGEGEGQILFTVETQDFNSGNETAGNSQVTHNSFVSSETIQKELAFTISTSQPSSSGGGSSSSSGGGRGGGSSSSSSGSSNSSEQGEVLGVSTSTPLDNEHTIALQKQLITILTQLVSLLQLQLQLMNI